MLLFENGKKLTQFEITRGEILQATSKQSSCCCHEDCVSLFYELNQIKSFKRKQKIYIFFYSNM